jgi:GntR family transcriptional regulator
MLLSIDTRDPRAIYEQVADGIKERIARRELKEGDALPPVRQLAADLGVNLNTIATAYRELQKQGLIAIRHGLGAVVASNTATERKHGELLTPLRAALTDMVLSGLSPAKILSLVVRELRAITRGSK